MDELQTDESELVQCEGCVAASLTQGIHIDQREIFMIPRRPAQEMHTIANNMQ